MLIVVMEEEMQIASKESFLEYFHQFKSEKTKGADSNI